MHIFLTYLEATKEPRNTTPWGTKSSIERSLKQTRYGLSITFIELAFDEINWKAYCHRPVTYLMAKLSIFENIYVSFVLKFTLHIFKQMNYGGVQ